MDSFKEGVDYYMQGGLLVLTEYYLTKIRSKCCGNGCRHCPFSPVHIKDNTILKTRKQ